MITQPMPVMQPVAQNSDLAYNQGQNQNLTSGYQTNSQQNMIPTEEPVRRYIPSSEGVKLDPDADKEKNDKIKNALNKSYKAEGWVNKYGH